MCQCCGTAQVYTNDGQPFKPRWHVHHLRYANLGCEPDEDLTLLCSACHNVVHKPMSEAAIYWQAYLKENEREISEEYFNSLRPQSYSEPEKNEDDEWF